MSIRRIIFFLFSVVLSNFAAQSSAGDATALAIVPLPASMERKEGAFELTEHVSVFSAPELAQSADAVNLLLAPATGFRFPSVAQARDASIRIQLDRAIAAEGYRLSVDSAGIEIAAATNAGAFYALQSLRQLLPKDIYSAKLVQRQWAVPAVIIEDEPRFGWRGLHLDVGRHFRTVAFVKRYIDLLALHKMNRFHWHLTEDQGWRIEIKQYPRLTEIGSRRAQTVMTFSMWNPEDATYDGIPHEGFYTQDQIRDVVAYAATRHVTVMPEIEFPGHAQAAIAAYPQLGNTGKQLKVKEEWGISKNTIKPSAETLAFYRNVLTEVLALFPSEYIHIGGDEAPKDQWEESSYAQQRIAELGLEDEYGLQSWLVQQMDDFLTQNGRKLIGWDEIMQGGLSSNATVMSWRGMKPGAKAASAGRDVVMAPTSHTYFDYYQADASTEPEALPFYLPLETVYAFEPVPEGLSVDLHKHILGGQGQLWSELMKTPEHVEYMAFPRSVALAEVLWSPREARDYEHFLPRLETHLKRLDQLGVNYRPLGGDELTLKGRIKQRVLKTLMTVYFWWQDV